MIEGLDGTLKNMALSREPHLFLLCLSLTETDEFTMWIVDISETKYQCGPYGKEYFPRKFYYKKDANKLISILDKDYGIKANLMKVKNNET